MASNSALPRVLVIEDDRLAASALKGLLTPRGWNVVIAPTISHAMPFLLQQSQQLDAIILDLMLPDGDGEIILELLKSRFPPIPVAVTTGVSDDQRIQGVTRIGATVLLRKPIVLTELLKAITPRGASKGDA